MPEVDDLEPVDETLVVIVAEDDGDFFCLVDDDGAPAVFKSGDPEVEEARALLRGDVPRRREQCAVDERSGERADLGAERRPGERGAEDGDACGQQRAADRGAGNGEG